MIHVKSTVFPFDYDRNNCHLSENFNAWQRHVKIELNKMLGHDKAAKSLRFKALVRAAAKVSEPEYNQLVHTIKSL